MTPSGAHLEASAAGIVDSLHLGTVVNYLAPGRKIGSRHGEENIALRILKIFYRCAAGLFKVKAAYLACHADGYAGVARHEDVRKCRRQKRRLFHAPVVVIVKLDRVLINITKDIGAYRSKLCLCVSRCSKRHIARVDLAEVSFGVNKRR